MNKAPATISRECFEETEKWLMKIDPDTRIPWPVLLVEDSAEDVELTLVELARFGNLIVTVANSGARAFELLSTIKYRIVIVDLNLPTTSGVEVIREANARNVKSSFIILTGYAKDSPQYSEAMQVLETIKLGVPHYIGKPFTAEKFKEVVRAL